MPGDRRGHGAVLFLVVSVFAVLPHAAQAECSGSYMDEIDHELFPAFTYNGRNAVVSLIGCDAYQGIHERVRNAFEGGNRDNVVRSQREAIVSLLRGSSASQKTGDDIDGISGTPGGYRGNRDERLEDVALDDLVSTFQSRTGLSVSRDRLRDRMKQLAGSDVTRDAKDHARGEAEKHAARCIRGKLADKLSQTMREPDGYDDCDEGGATHFVTKYKEHIRQHFDRAVTDACETGEATNCPGSSTADADADGDGDDGDGDGDGGSGTGDGDGEDPPASSTGQDSEQPMGDDAQVDLAVLTQEIPFGTEDGPANAEECVEYLNSRAASEDIERQAYTPELARTICESQYREFLAGGRSGAGDRAGDERVLLEEGARTGTETRNLLDQAEFGVFARISSGVWVSEIADALERAFCEGDSACRDELQLYGPGGLVEFLAVANGNVSNPSAISASDWLWIPPKACFDKVRSGEAARGTDTASVEQGEFCQCYYDPTRFPAECPTCQTLTEATTTANNLEQALGAAAIYGGGGDPGAWEQATTQLEAARQEQGTLNEAMGEVCARAGGAPPSE